MYGGSLGRGTPYHLTLSVCQRSVGDSQYGRSEAANYLTVSSAWKKLRYQRDKLYL